MTEVTKASVFDRLPAVAYDREEIKRALAEAIASSNDCIAVLDDDPTGIQTVHGINVYMDWRCADIEAAVRNEKLFYIQTNTRGVVDSECTEIDRTLAGRLFEAGKKIGRTVRIISRGDSTLRGHFPLETQVVAAAMKESGEGLPDGEIIAPCFFEAERYTIDNIHYVGQGEMLVPAGETEFATDTTFPFKNSDLRDYVREKCGAATEVISIPIELIRAGKVDIITELLCECGAGTRIIVNAACYEDLEVFVLALYHAEAMGKKYLFRTAASFVRVYGGITPKPPISAEQFMAITGGRRCGIVAVGSHVKKSTDQLNKLLSLPYCHSIELDANRLITDEFAAEIKEKAAIAMSAYSKGEVPVVFTSRAVLKSTESGSMGNLKLSTLISQRFTEFIDALDIAPAFFIAKGGITSSDMATKACRIKKAAVMGQALPGIPAVTAGEGSRWPGMLYIIFPGNVGDENALRDVVERLMS